MFTKILLASDGSAHSLRAAEQAIDMANNSGAHVVVLYVVDNKTSKAVALQNLNAEGITQLRQEKIKSIEKKAQEARVSYEIKIIRGEPAPSIVAYAQEHAMDIILIGSRGLNGLQQFVLGSVSHKVAKLAKCPVMIIK